MMYKYSQVFFIFIFFIFLNTGFSQGNRQYDKNIPTGDRKSILQLLELIESNCDIVINYSPSHINLKKTIVFYKRESSVLEILNSISVQENLDLITNGNNAYLFRNLRHKQDNDTEISLSGYLKDFDSGEPLIGANIWTNDLRFGQFSDNKGYFNLKIPQNTDTVFISYVGYSKVIISGKNLKTGVLGDINLKKTLMLREVIIDDSIQKSKMELKDFQRQKYSYKLNGNISKYGISDAFNELIMKPGIIKVNDFQGGLSVNGSSPGDNIYYLDGIRIFEPNHIFGLFSSFSSKPVNNISLYSSTIPLNYSGAFSSVMDFHTRDGNSRKHEIETGLSNSAANFFITGPLKKNTTSYFIDYRHSLLDLYLPQIIKKYKDIDFRKLFFNDLNVKINHTINQYNRISAFYYQGNDQINISNNSQQFVDSENDFSWLNRTTGIFWTFIYDDDFKSDLSLSLAGYTNNSFSEFRLHDIGDTKQYLNIYSSTRIRELSFKHDFIFYLKNSRTKFGYNFSKFNVSPVLGGFISQAGSENIYIEHEKDSIINNLMTYVSCELYLNRYIELKTGFQIGHVYNKIYKNTCFNPQVSFSVKTAQNIFFELIYSRSNKFIHSLGSYAVGIPSMIWITSGRDVPGSVSDNLSLNLVYKIPSFQLGGELYYKYMNDLLTYRNSIDAYNPLASKSALIPVFHNSLSVPDNISAGIGIAYGFNLSGQFILPKLESSFAFSVNKMKEKYNDLNKGDWFSGKYDQDYSIAASIIYKLQNMNMFVNWKYHSGQVFTLPVYIINNSTGKEILDFNILNNARLGDYHSLDIGLNHIKGFKKIILKTSVGASNIYNHFNPVYAYVFKETDVYNVAQVGGIPFNPYISFELKF